MSTATMLINENGPPLTKTTTISHKLINKYIKHAVISGEIALRSRHSV